MSEPSRVVMMRGVWALGLAHGLIGSAILFASFHPLRDALDAHALALAVSGSTLQLGQGLALLLLAQRPGLAWPARLIGAGATIWTAMLYVIVFTGSHPFDAAVPVGGAIMLLGWVWALARWRRA